MRWWGQVSEGLSRGECFILVAIVLFAAEGEARRRAISDPYWDLRRFHPGVRPKFKVRMWRQALPSRAP